MAAPDRVAACGRIVADVDVKPKQVYVEARFVALNVVNDYPKGFHENK